MNMNMHKYLGLSAPLLCLCIIASTASDAFAQAAETRVSREAYIDVPFDVVIVTEGFDKKSQPDPPTISSPDGSFRFLGVEPQYTQLIVNGRRSQTVRYVFRYAAQTQQTRFTIPAVTIQKGNKKATTRPVTIALRQVTTSKYMDVELVIPQRPVWVGETFPIYIDFFAKRDFDDPQFVLPAFDDESLFQIETSPNKKSKSFPFTIAGRSLSLPYTKKSVRRKGTSYTRFRFTALATPQKPGNQTLPPAIVTAKVQTGTSRDSFGFSVPRLSFEKAQDKKKTIVIKGLPTSSQPIYFNGAVGAKFSIDVTAEQTVVRQGEPIPLSVTIRGQTNILGLRLPTLDHKRGLPSTQFSIIDVPSAGELLPDGSGKKFQVTVAAKTDTIREIPAIAMAYFDAEHASYRTVSSSPIALSVRGGQSIGAQDVVTDKANTDDAETKKLSQHSKKKTPASVAKNKAFSAAMDVALSSPEQAAKRSSSLSDITWWLIFLYCGPLVLLFVKWVVLRSALLTEESRKTRLLASSLHKQLRLAENTPRGSLASTLLSNMRSFAKITTGTTNHKVITEVENAAYSPSQAKEPLPPELIATAQTCLRTWHQQQKKRSTKQAPVVTIVASLVALLAIAWPMTAKADSVVTNEASASARTEYTKALSEKDIDNKRQHYQRAATAFVQAIKKQPTHSHLFVDAGHAYLGGGKVGQATALYRRALQVDPKNQRAKDSLQKLQANVPHWVPIRSLDAAQATSVLFFHHSFTKVQKHILAAILFFIAILAITFLRSSLRNTISTVALLGWIILLLSALWPSEQNQWAVTSEQDTALYSADNRGALQVTENLFPAGTEMLVQENRNEWSRIALADGITGWVLSSNLIYPSSF